LEAVSYGKDNIADKRFKIFHANYSQIDALFSEQQFNGILLDLGTCSTHLDNHSRGFSFQGEGPLDMRMDTSQGFSAEQEISDVIYKYGEEKASRRIAKAIVEFRNHTLIHSTSDLVKIIEGVLKRTGKKHPATKTFQAIRIHVNNELEHLEIALGKLSQLLNANGVIAIISFHSLEDRIVKNFFKPNIQSLPKDIPINNVVKESFHCIKKKIKPSAEEIKRNPRSRSAVMRVYSKL
jgi:16S rRNA (cytosine1402-N4)-methyltransferase